MAAGAEITGSTISAVLAGKRGLNRKHIMALARYFSVSPAVFLASEPRKGVRNEIRRIES